MAFVVLFARRISDRAGARPSRIDVSSVLLSAVGLVFVVLGMLQSKTWGWITRCTRRDQRRRRSRRSASRSARGSSLAGVALLAVVRRRQRHSSAPERQPLVDVALFRILRLRSGLTVLGAQYAMTAGLFFMVPVYLQMTLGLDALETGIRIFPLSISLILFSIARHAALAVWSPRRIVRVGRCSSCSRRSCCSARSTSSCRASAFGFGMFAAGAALGLLASQLGNVNMSSVSE